MYLQCARSRARVCVCVCVRACVRACVRVCVRACVSERDREQRQSVFCPCYSFILFSWYTKKTRTVSSSQEQNGLTSNTRLNPSAPVQTTIITVQNGWKRFSSRNWRRRQFLGYSTKTQRRTTLSFHRPVHFRSLFPLHLHSFLTLFCAFAPHN